MYQCIIVHNLHIKIFDVVIILYVQKFLKNECSLIYFAQYISLCGCQQKKIKYRVWVILLINVTMSYVTHLKLINNLKMT